MTLIDHIKQNRTEVIACTIGIVLGAFLTDTLFLSPPANDPYDTAYHTHADFAVYVRGERLDFSNPDYMTTNEQSLHTDVHLHDEVGSVIHYHAPDITLSEFLSSLGYTLTNDCFIIPTGAPFCSEEAEQLQLYVNGALYMDDISAYVPADLDRIVVHFGNPADERIATYLNEVSDEACIYSGSCPERGTAPPESCGLTCEL